jgi:hypothetical protein
MYPERNTRLRRLLPTRVLFLLTLVMAAATTCVGVPTAWAANVTCTSVMSGDASGPLTIKGNVIVPIDAHCTLSFVNVTGNVQAAPGSTLLISAYTAISSAMRTPRTPRPAWRGSARSQETCRYR